MKDSNSAGERIKFLQEAAIMKQFAHQNVVFMFGVVTKRYPVSKSVFTTPFRGVCRHVVSCIALITLMY